MVIREMTTWEMPFTAALCHRDRDRAKMSKVTGKSVVLIQTSWLLTVEWPSLLPFSSVTAMPFRISLEEKNKEKRFISALSSSSIHWHLFVDFWTCWLQNEGFSWPDESNSETVKIFSVLNYNLVSLAAKWATLGPSKTSQKKPVVIWKPEKYRHNYVMQSIAVKHERLWEAWMSKTVGLSCTSPSRICTAQHKSRLHIH